MPLRPFSLAPGKLPSMDVPSGGAAAGQPSKNDEARRAKIKEFMLSSNANKMARARANEKDKLHRFSRWLLYFEAWTLVFWLGLAGYVAYRLAYADDGSFGDTLNVAWKNATEFSFDRSKLDNAIAKATGKAPDDAAASKAEADAIIGALEALDAKSNGKET